jgi:hypothetical protein
MDMTGIYSLIRSSAAEGHVLVLDCLSRVEPYGLRAMGSIRPYLDSVHIKRAFTSHQLRSMAGGLDAWASGNSPATLIIVGMGSILEDVDEGERAFIRGYVLKNAKRLARTRGARVIFVETDARRRTLAPARSGAGRQDRLTGVA